MENQSDNGLYQNRSGAPGTATVTPCCEGDGVIVQADGRTLTPEEIRYRLNITAADMSAALDVMVGKSVEDAMRKQAGISRQDERSNRRENARIRKVLRDSAIRKLKKQGQGVREIACYLHVGVGTVQRALAPGAAHQTNTIRAEFIAAGNPIPAAAISTIRDMLKADAEDRNDKGVGT